MSTSMVSTVLEIEREAEDIITSAQNEAATLLENAKASCQAATEEAHSKTENEVKALEAQAAEDRSLKVKELTAVGEANLSKVRRVSEAAFDKGVQLIMAALAGK